MYPDSDMDYHEKFHGPEQPETELRIDSCDSCDAKSVVSITYNGEHYQYCMAHRDEALAAWQNSQEAQAEQNIADYYGSTSGTVSEQAKAAHKAKREGW